MEPEYQSDYDWQAIRLNYITCERLPLLRVFAEQNKVPYKLLRDYISKENWKDERTDFLVQLRRERMNKAIAQSVEDYQTVTQRNIQLAMQLQDIIDNQLELAQEEIANGGTDKSRMIRSCDVLNYTSAIKNITEIMKSNSDITFGLNALVSAGIVTTEQVKGIQQAIASGDVQMRLKLGEVFQGESDTCVE